MEVQGKIKLIGETKLLGPMGLEKENW